MSKALLIVIPVLNEEKHIASVLEFVDRNVSGYEATVVVADGGSRDDTARIVNEYEARSFSLHLMDNPCKIQSSGINRAVKKYARGNSVLVRLDAHSEYPEGFIDKIVSPIFSREASSVVVSMETMGGNNFQNVQRDLFNSPVGNGGSAHRQKTPVSKYVEHGHHAAFDLDAFCDVGMYDERLAANEDAELDRRLVKNGYKIYLNAEATIGYIPRETLKGLALQYFRNGKFRMLSARVDGSSLGLRQLIPMGVLGSLLMFVLALLVFQFFNIMAAAVLALPFVLYFILIFLGAVCYSQAALKTSVLTFVVAAMATHLAFALGVLKGALEKGWYDVEKS